MRKLFFWRAACALVLAAGTGFVLLDTFVVPKALAAAPQTVQAAGAQQQPAASPQGTGAASAGPDDAPTAASVLTGTSYRADGLEISIDTEVIDGTTFYFADVYTDDPAALKTALADGIYGRNIKETTSDMASENNAVLAVNGDYYGFRDTGYVIRNGVLYRGTARAAGDDDALVIDANGDFSIIRESEVTAEVLLAGGAQQVFSFGPALVENGAVTVGENDEVDRAMASNPRTAIGQIGAGHYLLVVCDGRTQESKGVSLHRLAEEMAARGCTTAYNLDGGGSSTLVFGGQVLNNPAGGRNNNSEREVSDIVYF